MDVIYLLHCTPDASSTTMPASHPAPPATIPRRRGFTSGDAVNLLETLALVADIELGLLLVLSVARRLP